jgi:hypothetical protein
LSDLSEIWIFLKKFDKNNQISNLMKVRPVGAELFHAAVRSFCERAQKKHKRTLERSVII